MLASAFGKITSSLGKTYILSGLIPSSIFLLYFVLFNKTIGDITQIFQRTLASDDAWKGYAPLGALWLLLGFIFYAARTPIFSFFQLNPTGFIGRRLVFRRVAQRELLRRKESEYAWRLTSMLWAMKLDLDRKEIGDPPDFVRRLVSTERAIANSERGRVALTRVDRTVGDCLRLSVRDSEEIASGIFSLYVLSCRAHGLEVERIISQEIESWKFCIASPQADRILEFVQQDLQRLWSSCFSDYKQFGDGPYVFPTELGNRLSVLDDYSEKRYGIDTATFWDRIWWVLPDSARKEVSDARLSLETLVNITAASILASLILTAVGIYDHLLPVIYSNASSPSTIKYILFIAVSLFISVLTYRGAILALDVFAGKVTTLIDMYRLNMLEHLGFSPPNVGEELWLHRQLKGFFTQNDQMDLRSLLVLPSKRSK